MFINIITPCSRPQNLKKIAKSINIPRANYRWIVVCDRYFYPYLGYIPANCEIYCHKNKKSKFGNAQRNYALAKITEGYIYFNDDDTLMHTRFWDSIKDEQADFIHFKQLCEGNLRFDENIKVGNIDSHSFLTHFDIVKDLYFDIEAYDADALFAIDSSKKAKKIKFLNEVLSEYNILR